MSRNVKNEIEMIAKQLGENYRKQGLFEMGVGARPPKRSEIIELVDDLRRVIFPGYIGNENTAYVSLDSFADHMLAIVYEKMYKQIKTALIYTAETCKGTDCIPCAEELTMTFMESIPKIQALLMKDVEAEFNGDPAANSREEIIFCYPGVFAIFVYRIAHVLYELKVPFIPRIMSEYAHSETGIDINPGATIGEYFFIDHGTGIVIGETTVIGDHVKIYQGVTLGALSTSKGQQLSGVKRHPTIEDHVVIYSNTTILGGETVIGENSVVAGNCFVTTSIPKDTRVSNVMPELKMKNR